MIQLIHFRALSLEIFLDIPTHKWNFIYANKNVYLEFILIQIFRKPWE